MSRPGRLQSGVAYALALLMAITGFAGLVGVTSPSASAQGASNVFVSCSQALGGGATECVISAPGADQLMVPAANVCASFSATTGAVSDAAFVSPAGSPSISFSYQVPVSIGDGGTYQVLTGGSVSEISGQTILCPEISLPAENTDDDDSLPQEVAEPPATTEIGGGSSDSGTAQPSGTDAATTEPSGTSTVPAGGDGEIEPAAVIVDPETTPESGIPADPVHVTVVALICDTDPGSGTDGCVAAPNVSFSASDSSGSLGSASTDGAGNPAGFDSTAGGTFIVYQTTVIDGYRPTGDGRYEVQQLTGDLTITFVNVLRVELGRLQVVAGLCPTSGESRTEFTIADQSHFQTASLTECGANPGSVFVVSSDSLPEGSWTIRTESDGAWRGYVPAGTYTVTAADGTVSDSIVVVADAVSVAVAVTYVHQEQGTLELQYVFCTAGTEGEYIAVNPAGAPDASCSPSAASITLVDELAGDLATEITVGSNGSTPVALKPGLYRVTGPEGIASELVTITAEQTSVVRVSTVVTTGSLLIYGKLCPAGSGSAPSNPSASCSNAHGNQTLTIEGPGGSSDITTSGSGTTTVNGLAQGSYSLSGALVCAVQDSTGAAAANFSIQAGQTTILTVYHCPIDDGTGGGGNGGVSGPGNGDGTGGDGAPIGNPGGNPGAGDGTDPNQYTGGVGGDGPDADGTGGTAALGIYASNSHLLVRGLPAAGSGDGGASNLWWPILLLTGAAALAIFGWKQQKPVRQRVRVRRDQ